ncbi:MAG: hypothetical protein JNN18_20590 [Rubrivivax sp.]|nr:hypothetical protein [Rubrivivax sp.]
MNRYNVVAADPVTGIVAVQDEQGHCHLGRAQAVVPKGGDVLLGPALGVGPQTLRLAPAEAPCPLVVVLLDCDPEVAKLVVAVPAPA